MLKRFIKNLSQFRHLDSKKEPVYAVFDDSQFYIALKFYIESNFQSYICIYLVSGAKFLEMF